MWQCLISVGFITLGAVILLIKSVCLHNDYASVGCVQANTLYKQRFCEHGTTIVLECSILGGGATVWQGNLFNQCQNHDDIVLRHSQFNSTGAMINITCDNNLSVSGYAVDVNENMYTSRLIIDFSKDLSGKTVECANQSKSIIGNYVITIEPGKQIVNCR